MRFGIKTGVFCEMQEFLHNSSHSVNTEGPKAKPQGARNRRRCSRTRTSRRSRTTAKAKEGSASTTRERQFFPVARGLNGRFLSESERNSQQAMNSQEMVPCHALRTSAGHVRTLTYAEKMKDYIAQAIIQDSENDESRSPPALSRVYSNSPAAEPRYFRKCSSRQENVSRLHSDSMPSITRTVACTEALTPCKAEVEIYDDSPAAKRRLFRDSPCAEANSDSRVSSEAVVAQVGHQNGYRTLRKFLTTSLNGRTLGPVDHYEDGLLAIANAACLMSTGVSDGCRNQNNVSENQG